jgi:Co/Zn/Cd efflux system component
MSATCGGCQAKFDGLSPAYRRVLTLVIAINATMFVVEVFSGYLAASKALQADALDFLGDAATYGLSLYVIGKPAAWRSNAALVKGVTLGLFGLWVLVSTLWRVFAAGVPEAAIMGGIGGLALAANVTAALLLFRFRDGDANVRSVWLCSRNDAIGNLAVIAAAGGVAVTASAWPDLLVAALMAALFLSSSLRIVRQARAERPAPQPAPVVPGSV